MISIGSNQVRNLYIGSGSLAPTRCYLVTQGSNIKYYYGGPYGLGLDNIYPPSSNAILNRKSTIALSSDEVIDLKSLDGINKLPRGVLGEIIGGNVGTLDAIFRLLDRGDNVGNGLTVETITTTSLYFYYNNFPILEISNWNHNYPTLIWVWWEPIINNTEKYYLYVYVKCRDSGGEFIHAHTRKDIDNINMFNYAYGYGNKVTITAAVY